MRFLVILPLNHPIPISIIDLILNNRPNTPRADNPKVFNINGNSINPVSIFDPIAI
jgi:hypothetical protein